MRAVHFGAGSIGRGFIGDLLYESGYQITFVDVNPQIIQQINQTNSYDLYLIEENHAKKTIYPVQAFSLIENEEEVIAAIVDADVITTSVWANNLVKIAPILRKGLTLRAQAEKQKINVLACENAMFNSELLKKYILEDQTMLTEDELAQVASFPNTGVDRLVIEDQMDGESVIRIGKDFELVIEKNRLADSNSLPIRHAQYTNHLLKYLERKLYIINGGHAWAGYIGHLKGYQIIQDVLQNQQLLEEVQQTMMESARLLVKKYDFQMDDLVDYIHFALSRFLIPGIRDPIERVCRSPIRKLSPNDRLVGPCQQCEAYGLENQRLLQGIAAAFLYYQPRDPQSIKIQKHVKEEGIENAITYYTGIDRHSRMHEQILKFYKALKN